MFVLELHLFSKLHKEIIEKQKVTYSALQNAALISWWQGRENEDLKTLKCSFM